MSVITVERKVLEKNDEIAGKLREEFRKHKIFVLNVLSSPGAGKTTLLERTIERLRGTTRIAVIEGDVQTDLDAQRVAKYGIPAVQIVTRGGCHLEAGLVRDAMSSLDLSAIDVLVIENVGNLVCPANYDLGEAVKVVVASTTEGDDKPLKYPAMFRNASVLIINKIDLVPYLTTNPDTLQANAHSINPALHVFRTSCTSGEGLDAWTSWIMQQSAKTKA
jgi:hydrogenase nickel incorporation protein HypB